MKRVFNIILSLTGFMINDLGAVLQWEHPSSWWPMLLIAGGVFLALWGYSNTRENSERKHRQIYPLQKSGTIKLCNQEIIDGMMVAEWIGYEDIT